MNSICNECETVAHCMAHGCIPKQPVAPVQEPVAWMYKDKYGNLNQSSSPTVPPDSFPVYTTPPGGRQSEDCLTAAPMQDDIADFIAGAFGVSRGTAYDLMREALKEVAPAQEPVAGPRMTIDASAPIVMTPHPAFTRQPTAQRQGVSLTDEQINELRQQYGVTSDGRGIKEFTYVCDFVRAIEAKLRAVNGFSCDATEKNGGQA